MTGKRQRPPSPPPVVPSGERLYEVRIQKPVRKEWEALDATDKARVREKLKGLRRNPRPPDCEKLKGVPRGKPDLYRVRVGALRIVYTVKDEVLLVLVLGIRDRKEVYEALHTFLARTN